MTVQCKFLMQSIQHIATHSPTDVAAEVKLCAVWGDGTGNLSWSKATPQGEIKMMITNPDAIADFDLGESYVVTFAKAPR